MFIIGKATVEEIKEMKDMGFEVEDVDMGHFDKAMGSTGNEEDYKPDRYDPDKFVSVWLDYDIVQEMRNINLKEVTSGIK